MPLFDFQCAGCKSTFEELLKSSTSKETVRCAKCGSTRVERLLSVFAAPASRPSSSGSAPKAMPLPRRGGCGGGCACH